MRDHDEGPLLQTDELAALRAIGIERTFRPGQRLVSIGSKSTEVFYLMDGLVKIVVTSAAGNESVFGLRSPGDLVGEMSVLNNEVRSADVIAVEPTTAVVVSSPRFIEYLGRFPAVSLALLRMQTRRLNEMTARSMLGARSVKARIAQRLIELSSSNERGSTVELTQSDLAQYIDASREWTSKALGELRREGAITTSRGRITILDASALHEAALDI